MRTVGSRPTWQTAVAFVAFVGAFTGLLYVFRGNLLAQVAIFAVMGGGLSLTALREKTRAAKLARASLGPFVFFTSLYTIPEVDAALLPAVAFGILATYYGFAGVVVEDPLGVDDGLRERR